MKNIIRVILSVFLTAILFACSTDQESTYTVKYGISDSNIVTTDLTFFEFNDAGEKIANNSIHDAKNGSSTRFVSSTKAVKIKVMITMSTAYEDDQFWVQQVYYLNQGGNLDISVVGTTIIGPNEP